jgi:hypothetical protein
MVLVLLMRCFRCSGFLVDGDATLASTARDERKRSSFLSEAVDIIGAYVYNAFACVIRIQCGIRVAPDLKRRFERLPQDLRVVRALAVHPPST